MNDAGNLAIQLLLLGIVVGLVFHVMAQIRQRNALATWLDNPELNDIPDGSGAWHGIFSRLQNLRKKEEKDSIALSRSLDRFRQAAQALPDGIILLNEQTQIEWLNTAACRHFALDPVRDIGTLVGQLIRHSEFHGQLAVFRHGSPVEPVLLRIGANGQERALSVMPIPFAIGGTLLHSHDVTERMRAETIHRDFIANVSHELRTPLTVITGFIEQFNSDEPPAGKAARTFLGLMAEQTTRMNRLVTDLLTLSRLENSAQPPREEIVDIPALLESLRTEALALSAGKHEIGVAETAAGKLRGSADELRSAFGNLVFNAVRYTPAGGKITLAWRRVDGAPTFSVADKGIGILAEHIPRLTERFYRVDKGRSTTSGGTGLGLAIVKHVLARHGGTLHIQSTPGQGSTFSAELPADRIV
jgi:two-component system phosphate regulon sensor histidine kinase PhoR